MLGTGFWMLEIGCWIQDAGIQYQVSSEIFVNSVPRVSGLNDFLKHSSIFLEAPKKT